MDVKKGNMYPESKKNISPSVGCNHQCIYCVNSFQLQLKRRKNVCEKCWSFIPHNHRERLEQLKGSLPRTNEGQFIWINSSGDIAFADKKLMKETIDLVSLRTDRTFLFQTKDPSCLKHYEFPPNAILAITLETNRDEGYSEVSKAPLPTERNKTFLDLNLENPLMYTIEPIIDFDLLPILEMIREGAPVVVNIGYDSKNSKKYSLKEPSLKKTMQLCKELNKFTIVKTKTIREKKNISTV